ncbi:MAG TPA: hypothetical protein VG164_02990 [Trebonia sp.]|jgi:hypothetical protein|nr:hypothetical protein [Trebonia sp.]
MSPVSRGFKHFRRATDDEEKRDPPGQYLAHGFPVLSAGPTPHTPLADWTFAVTQSRPTSPKSSAPATSSRCAARSAATSCGRPAANPLAFVCGPTSFVETAAAGLVGLGYPPERVKTERFGASGEAGAGEAGEGR